MIRVTLLKMFLCSKTMKIVEGNHCKKKIIYRKSFNCDNNKIIYFTEIIIIIFGLPGILAIFCLHVYNRYILFLQVTQISTGEVANSLFISKFIRIFNTELK